MPRKHLIALAVIAVLGWGAAAFVYLTATDDAALPLELTQDAKLNQGRLQRMGGDSALLYEQINEAWKSLWHGANLGITLFVITSLVLLVYFLRVTRHHA